MNNSKLKQIIGLQAYHSCARNCTCGKRNRPTRAKKQVTEKKQLKKLIPKKKK